MNLVCSKAYLFLPNQIPPATFLHGLTSVFQLLAIRGAPVVRNFDRYTVTN